MLAQNTLKRSTSIRESLGDRIFLGGVYLFLTVVLLAVLYPLIYVVSSSFSSPLAVSSGRVWLWPVDFSLRGYQVTLSNPQIITGYVNSIYYTFFGTLISVTLTVLVAYPLSRRTLFGRVSEAVLKIRRHRKMRGLHNRPSIFEHVITRGPIPRVTIELHRRIREHRALLGSNRHATGRAHRERQQ